MKQSTAKTLGVTALGAAFAAAGAGAAQATPSVSDVTTLVATANKTVPVGEGAVTNTLRAASPTVQQVVPQVLGNGLLGGLPLANGLGTNSLPLGI